jgi:hypothetical protein
MTATPTPTLPDIIQQHGAEIDKALRSLPPSEDRDHARGRLEDALHYAQKACGATAPSPKATAIVDPFSPSYSVRAAESEEPPIPRCQENCVWCDSVDPRHMVTTAQQGDTDA